MKTNRYPDPPHASGACCSFDWAEVAEPAGSCIRPGGTLLTERAVEVCGLTPASLVADIGCGPGGTLEYLERKGACRAMGIDCSETLLKEAGTRAGACRLVLGKAESLPLKAGLFDALFCECVLSILKDRGASIQEFRRILKEGGFLVLSDVFFLSQAAPDLPEREAQPCPAEGLLGKGDLLSLLSEYGFSIVLWEEHGRLLKEFLARAILAGVGLPDPWGCGRGRGEGKAGAGKLSYFLLVARKNGGGS